MLSVFLLLLLSGPDSIPGRVHRPEFVRFWLEELNPPLEVQSLLRDGYIPDFVSWPPAAELPNNASARDEENRQFLDSEIAELVASGAISHVSEKPWCVNPLQVVTLSLIHI